MLSKYTYIRPGVEHIRGDLICEQEGDFMNVERNTDWIWDWSSRPDQAPPKDWKFKHPKRKTYSIRHAKVGKNSLFSKEVLYTLFLTNFISLLLGTGVGPLFVAVDLGCTGLGLVSPLQMNMLESSCDL
uniref:Uncharacterized protein n=1 Tax=Timema monikensis TaxID=170555 RepID=A0A7R9HSV8_9NEOP|nr:unnamed protein product [Timema monikensis]